MKFKERENGLNYQLMNCLLFLMISEYSKKKYYLIRQKPLYPIGDTI